MWDLYRESPKGIAAIDEFALAAEEGTEIELLKKYAPLQINEMQKLDLQEYFEVIWCYAIEEHPNDTGPDSLDRARELYQDIISQGVRVNGESYIERGNYSHVLSLNYVYSILLYYYSPEYFFPNLFVDRFFDLNKIADTFEINLPPIPKKSDYKARCMYYWDMCETLHAFRQENGLTPPELCAFLYDFAPNFIPKEKTDIPKPAQAWFIGGLLDSVADSLNFMFWQANKDTKKGDILIHYETSPVSAITCLWIAQTDGVVDPFFHYYSNAYIGARIEFPRIALKELQTDPYFSTHSLVRKKFQGVNGWPVTAEDYSELLRMLKAKGFNIDDLPGLHAPSKSQELNIRNERDVETALIDFYLSEVGLMENKDYVRQLGIRAGRGSRVYPDYALHFDDTPGYERAQILIEAKYHMKTNSDVEECFKQARSYANILESNIIILCDKDCLMIYKKDNSFDRDRYKKNYWEELKHPDAYNAFKKILNP